MNLGLLSVIFGGALLIFFISEPLHSTLQLPRESLTDGDHKSAEKEGGGKNLTP